MDCMAVKCILIIVLAIKAFMRSPKTWQLHIMHVGANSLVTVQDVALIKITCVLWGMSDTSFMTRIALYPFGLSLSIYASVPISCRD